MKTKILFCVDLHLSEKAFQQIKKKSKTAELIVCAGDFTLFNQNIHQMIKRFNSLKKKILIIPGNHEDPLHLKELVKKYKNIIDIDNKFFKYKNILFYGNSEGGFMQYDPKLEKKINKIKKKFKEFKKLNENNKTIIIFHSPPYNTNLDLIEDFKEHVGSKTKRKLIRLAKPNLAIAGHIHECAYKKDILFNTKLLNPGPNGRIINI